MNHAFGSFSLPVAYLLELEALNRFSVTLIKIKVSFVQLHRIPREHTEIFILLSRFGKRWSSNIVRVGVPSLFTIGQSRCSRSNLHLLVV